MIRIDRASGFSPASVIRPPQAVLSTAAPKARPAPTAVLAQPVSVDSELREIERFLGEAREQQASVERNYQSLILAIGQVEADVAVAQARASVEMYEAAYAEAGGT
jgi:hypothetical protein